MIFNGPYNSYLLILNLSHFLAKHFMFDYITLSRKIKIVNCLLNQYDKLYIYIYIYNKYIITILVLQIILFFVVV